MAVTCMRTGFAAFSLVIFMGFIPSGQPGCCCNYVSFLLLQHTSHVLRDT